MKLIIANHIDPSIRDRGDLRAWTQRAFWFADAGDIVIVSSPPDAEFLHHVAGLKGINSQQLRVIIAPPGRYDGMLLDPDTLADPALLEAVRGAVAPETLDQIFALWPSPSVARLAEALGIPNRLVGAGFFAQGGGELCNNKAIFRALAAAAGVPIPRGAICRTQHEALDMSSRLLRETGAVMVKQAHNGAGMGNQLLVNSPSLAVDHVGARHLHVLSGDLAEALAGYWQQRWDWASADGRFPVVVEEFVPDADTIYSEHFVSDDATRHTEAGSLHYVDRRLSYQIVPLRGVAHDTRQQLTVGGRLLADAYRSLGYRGYLSADAIATPDGRVLFTEVNAQVSGSLHIYQEIAHKVVQVSREPFRSVVEYHVPPTWAVADWQTFTAAVTELDCAFDPVTRTGVIVSMPIVPLMQNLAQFVFCIAYATEQQRRAIFDRLDQRFAVNPPDAFASSDRVGVPQQPVQTPVSA